MKINFASDHAGFELKNELLTFVKEELHLEVSDHGAYEASPLDDYPDFIAPAAKAVAQNGERAIVLGGSGEGEAMAANRVSGVRAVVYYGGDKEIIKLSREHNDANVLALGARFISIDEAKEVVKIWLNTDYSKEEKHTRRNHKLDLINKSYLEKIWAKILG